MFVLSGSRLTAFDAPELGSNHFPRINDRGDVVGEYIKADPGAGAGGFRRDRHGRVSEIAYPRSFETVPLDINDRSSAGARGDPDPTRCRSPGAAADGRPGRSWVCVRTCTATEPRHGERYGGSISGVRLGIAHHLGWAVAVTASADHKVVDRRRIELVEPGVAAAPIHHEGKPLDDAAAAKLVAEVRASAERAAAAELDALAAALPGPIVSMSLRAWPPDFPDDIAVQRRVPYEARADSVMYRQVLAELARARGWDVHVYDAKDVEERAARILGPRADAVLRGPRATLGPPWAKDHRMALAATVVAG